MRQLPVVTIKIPLSNGQFREVEGKLFEVEGIRFVVHRDINKKSYYTVTEYSTGMAVPNTKTKRMTDAIKQTQHMITRYGVHVFQKAIERSKVVNE
jgi:dethiobiotin synthetase